MEKFIVAANKYLEKDIACYYHCDYVGFQKKGNPDFINRLKNMSKQYDELDLIDDFITVSDIVRADIAHIIDETHVNDYIVITVPRSKAEDKYAQCQLMFKKAISCAANAMGLKDGTNAIKRIKNTRTTHNWRDLKNRGPMPYPSITTDTCTINKDMVKDRNILLVDDIYTHGVFVAEDVLQTLLNLGAKSIIMYVIARAKQQ